MKPKYSWKPPIAFEGEIWSFRTGRGNEKIVVGEIHDVVTRYGYREYSARHAYDLMRMSPRTGRYFHEFIPEKSLIRKEGQK